MKNKVKDFLLDNSDHRLVVRGLGDHQMIQDDEIQTYVNNPYQYQNKTEYDFQNNDFSVRFRSYYKYFHFGTTWYSCNESNDEVESYRHTVRQSAEYQTRVADEKIKRQKLIKKIDHQVNCIEDCKDLLVKDLLDFIRNEELDAVGMIEHCKQSILHATIIKNILIPYTPHSYNPDGIVEPIDFDPGDLDAMPDEEEIDLDKENPRESLRESIDMFRYQ